MKKIIFLLIISLLIAGCSTGEVVKETDLSEKERYAKLEAEFACNLIDSESEEDVMAAMKDFGPLLEKYDFVAEDLEKLKNKYDDDNDFRILVLEEVDNLCPKKLKELI